MNTTRVTIPPSNPANLALASTLTAMRQANSADLTGANRRNSRAANAMRSADSAASGARSGMIAYHELASALAATQPTQDRLRAAMLAAGHTIADSGFVVATPVHCLRAAQAGADMRRARLTCTACGEYAEIVVSSGRVIHGDLDSTEHEITDWRSNLGVIACGQIASKPVITQRSLHVQYGVAKSECEKMW